jgi:hypothetical protein
LSMTNQYLLQRNSTGAQYVTLQTLAIHSLQPICNPSFSFMGLVFPSK